MARRRTLTSTRGAGHLIAALDALGDPAAKLIRFLDDDRAAAAPATFVPAPLAIPAALAPIIVPALVGGINPHAARTNLDALGGSRRGAERSRRDQGQKELLHRS